MIGPLLKREIETTFNVVRQRSNQNELTFICPQPGCGDSNGNRSVNLKNGKTSCWRCNVGGDFINWARKLGIRFSNAADVTSNLSLKELFDIKPEIRSILPVVAEVKLPAGFTRMADEPKNVYTRLIGEMAVRKNLLPEDLSAVGCGFTSVAPRWEAYAIFPVIEYGTVVYYQGRTYSEEPGDRTKKFPSNAEVTYGARYWIYNIDEVIAKKPRTVILVESILNVLSLKWYMAEQGVTDVVPVAVFKHKVSDEQFFKLSRMDHIQEICLMFDHDAIGASWRGAIKFVNRFKITVAEIPAGEDNKRLDPNDNVELAWKCFLTRSMHSPAAALRAMDDSWAAKQREKPSLMDDNIADLVLRNDESEF